MASLQEINSAIENARAAGNVEAVDTLTSLFERKRRAMIGLPPLPTAPDGSSKKEKTDEEVGFLENVATGFGAGFVGTAATTALGAATVLEEDAELKARKKILELQEDFTPEGGDKDSVLYKLGAATGSFGAFASTAVLGKAALPAAGIMAVASGAGEASERAREYGATEEERNAANLRGAGIGLLELVSLGRILNIPGLPDFMGKLAGKVTPETTKGIRNRLQRMAATGVEEGSMEAIAAVLQNLNEAGYNPEQVMFEMGVLEEGAYGAGAGAIVQGVADAIAPRRAGAKPADLKEDKGRSDKIRLGERHSDETQEEFDARQERARTERGDTQLDMFSDELDDAEIAALDKEQRKNEAERKRLEDPDEVEFDMLLAEETREAKEKEEADRAKEKESFEDNVDRRMRVDGVTKAEAERLERAERDKDIRATDDTKTLDIEDAIEDAKDKEYDKGVAEGFKTLDERRKAERREAQEVENLSSARDAEVEKNTRLGRRIVLDEVLDGVNKKFPKGGTDASLRQYIQQEFRKKMSEKGFRDPELNREENRSVETYLRLKGAEDFPMLPSDSDVSTLEARIKEKVDARKQTTRAPDTKTTGESVPSSARVVGDERADGTEKPRGAVEGRLDDSVSDTGRPVGREGEPDSPVSKLGLKPKEKVALDQLQKRFKSQNLSAEGKKAALRGLKGKIPEASYAALEKSFAPKDGSKQETVDTSLPTVNPKTEKLRYKRRGFKFVKDHPSFKADVTSMKRVAGMQAAKDVGRLSAEAKKILKKPERTRTAEEKQLLVEDQKLMKGQKATLTDLNSVSKYFDSFDNPMDALYTAAYEVAEGGTQMKTPKSEELGNLLSLYSDKDTMKPYVQGLGIRNAKKVLAWAEKNLSPETNAQVKARTQELKDAIKVASETKTKEERKQEAVDREARANKQDPKAVEARRKRMAEANEQRQAQRAEKEARKKKVSPEETASIKATEEFTNALNNPKTNPTNARTYQRLKTLAEKTDDPQTSLEALDKAAAKKITDTTETQKAVKNIEDTKVEKGQISKEDAKKSARTRGLNKAYKKFVGKKGITRLDVIAAYNKYGETYLLKEATPKEVIAAGESRAKERGMSFFHTNEALMKALETPLTERMNLLLLKGDLKGVLLEIAREAKSPQLKSIATAIAENIGTTKVEYLTDKQMNDVSKKKMGKTPDGILVGAFLHKENTIILNEDVPLTIHTLMHEATHAVVDLVLHKKGKMPAAKFLKRLHKETKGRLGKDYGSTNVFEFVAEAMSNPEFRSRLSGMKVGEANVFVLFMRHVANLLRGLVGLDSIPVDRSETINLDIFDQTVMRLMAPTPEAITKLDLELSPLIKEIRKTLAPSNIKAKAKALPKAIADYIKDARPKVNTVKLITKIINLQALSDLGKLDAVGLGDTGQQLLVDIENQQGLLEQYAAGVKKVLESYDAFTAKYGSKVADTLNRIIYNYEYGATIHQVDPTKPRSDYEGEFVDGNDLAEVWDAQQEQLNKLKTDEERAAVIEQFTTMRKEYAKQWARLRKALNIELKSLATDADKETIAEVAKKIDRVLFARESLSVYFPLVRQGKFKVAFKFVPDGRPEALESGFLMFEHLSERDAFIEDAKDNPKILTESVKAYDTDVEMRSVYKDAPSGSFVADVLQIMDKGKVSKEIQEDILQLYVNALPETSYARSLTQRLGTFGYIQNARVAMDTKGYSLASQSAKIESAARIRATKKDIRDAADVAENPYAKVVANTLINDHANFAMKGADRKGLEEYVKRANQVAFIYTLGFNLSSALVNMSQIPLFALPYLTPIYGFKETKAAISKAIKMMGSARNSLMEYYDVSGEGLGATYTLKESIKENIREGSLTKKEAEARIEELTKIIPLVKMAHLRGKLPKWNTLQELGVNERAGFMDKLAHVSAYAFSVGERFNTQTTLLFTYDLTMQKINAAREGNGKYESILQGQEVDVSALSDTQVQELAAEEALYQTQTVNAGGRLETAAPVSKQNWGRVAFMYKSYGMQMYYNMFKSGFAAIDLIFKGNKEQRSIARKQLAGVFLSSTLFAGISGIPIYGLISMIYDFFAEDEEDTADEVVRKYFGELAFKGPLSEILGSDVAARVKLTDLLFQENRFMRDPSVEEMAGYYLGGPALSTGKRLVRGVQDILDGETQRGFESLLPGGTGNLLQSIRYYKDDGVLTRSGNYIYEDITGMEIFSKALGFAPLDYTFEVERNSRNKRVDRAVTQRKTKLAEKYFKALQRSDFETMKDLRKDMEKYNKEHPYNPITKEYINRSMKARFKSKAEAFNGVTISPAMREIIRESDKEYDQF